MVNPHISVTGHLCLAVLLPSRCSALGCDAGTLYQGIVIWDCNMGLYYGIIFRDIITGSYYGIMLQDNITE